MRWSHAGLDCIRHIDFQVEDLEVTIKDMGDGTVVNLGPIEYRDKKNEEYHG